MNTPGIDVSSTKPTVPNFRLLWTIGFSGKRYLPPQIEAAVAWALREVLRELIKRANSVNAGLTAVSSLARGGGRPVRPGRSEARPPRRAAAIEMPFAVPVGGFHRIRSRGRR
ncbi:MAG: hypothetical protein AB9869_35250 [Verrucomicrobiia bacterium]